MNEIEAISVLETRIKYPNSDTYDGMCEAEYQQEAVVLAIEALREKAEKSTGCECCNNVVSTNQAGRKFYKPLPTDSISSQGEMCLAYDKDGWSIHFEDCNDTGVMCEASIGKCPMCGKRLEVEP